MKTAKSNLKTCTKGHTFYKSSACPTCPVCEKERRPADGFLSLIPAPARRALENNNITSLKKLAKYSENDLLQLHGVGPGTIPKLREALSREGLFLKK